MSEQPIPLTDTEREALRESIERVYRRHDGHPLVYVNRVEWIEALIESGVLAERDRRVRAAALAPIQALHTHNAWPVTPENLRWAATHEALCRSWIFDVLTGLADALAAAGADAAPNETTTGCTCANVHPAGTAHEDPDARSGAAVPSGHEQEGEVVTETIRGTFGDPLRTYTRKDHP